MTSVRCNECGAPLQVGGGARFVTCGYCKADLEVRREGGALTTELVRATESLALATSELSAHVRGLELRDELSALNEKKVALERDCHGLRSTLKGPSYGVMALVLLFVGLASLGVAAYFGDPQKEFGMRKDFVPVLGEILGAIMLFMCVLFGARFQRDRRRRSDARSRLEKARARLDEVRVRTAQIEAGLESARRT